MLPPPSTHMLSIHKHRHKSSQKPKLPGCHSWDTAGRWERMGKEEPINSTEGLLRSLHLPEVLFQVEEAFCQMRNINCVRSSHSFNKCWLYAFWHETRFWAPGIQNGGGSAPAARSQSSVGVKETSEQRNTIQRGRFWDQEGWWGHGGALPGHRLLGVIKGDHTSECFQ